MFGGAIYAEGHRFLEIDSSTFKNNIAYQGYGQNVYSLNANEQLLIENSEFSSYHNSIYSTGYEFISKNNNIFGVDGDSAVAALPFRSDGGGLFIEKTSRVTISDDTIFTGLTGRYGGCMYIEQDRSSTTTLDDYQGTFRNTEILITSTVF